MKHKYLAVIAPFALAALVLALLWTWTGQPASAHPSAASVWTVCTAGPPDCDYASVRDAVDAADEDDVIKIATGVYTGIQSRPVPPGYLNPPVSGMINQVVYLSKTLTIQGGYTTSNWITPDPVANPTTLDAEGQGRVLLIAGDITPTVEGLRITGGDATGLGGYSGINWDDHDTGGGICVINATATLSNNQVFNNTAGSFGSGGGLYLLNDDSTLINNTITANTANALYGGGLYTMFSVATLTGNTFSGNTAGWGGAVFLEFSPAELVGNDFSGNSCIMAGGALNVHTSDANIEENWISGNQASQAGGAMRLYGSSAIVSGNVITGNTTVGYGGAVHLWSSSSTLEGNLIADNTAGGTGGALEFWFSDAALVNNIIADNQAADVGTAAYILASNPRFLHNTIVQNTGTGISDGSAFFIDNYQTFYSNVAFTNTILVSHTLGFNLAVDNAVSLEGTLWGNEADWAGTLNIFTGTVNLWDDPAFVDPDSGDYRIGGGSAAIDTGVDTNVQDDIDGESRPMDGDGDGGSEFDIGADEFKRRYFAYLPLVNNYRSEGTLRLSSLAVSP